MVASISLSGKAANVDQQIADIKTALSLRISKLLDILPLLSAKVFEAKTAEPKWSASDRSLTPQDVLRVKKYEREPPSLDKILSDQLDLGIKTLYPEVSPMWRVDLHHSAGSDRVCIGLSVNHCIADGKGCFNLFRLLISPPFDLTKELSESQVCSVRGQALFVEASEVCYDQRPGLDLLLPSKFKSVILPRLPFVIQNYFKEKNFWPFALGKEIKHCEPGLVLTQFKDKDFLKNLKAVSKKLGLKSLHSLIHSSIVLGILSLALDEERRRPESDGGRPQAGEKIRIKTDTPIDIRNPDVGSVVGNFVANLGWEVELNETDSFLELTRNYEEHLNSKQGRDKAMKFAGMLAHIPDGENTPSNEKEPTKWESHFNSILSFTGSFSISNLGAMPSLSLNGCQVEDLVWCQTPSVFTVAMVIDVIGLLDNEMGQGGGFSIAIGYREGCLEKAAVKRLANTVQSTLHALIRGDVTEQSKLKDFL